MKIRPKRKDFQNLSTLSQKNKVLKEPEQVYIAKTINIARFVDRFFRFVADFWSMLGYSGDHLEMIRACSGGFLGIF